MVDKSKFLFPEEFRDALEYSNYYIKIVYKAHELHSEITKHLALTLPFSELNEVEKGKWMLLNYQRGLAFMVLAQLEELKLFFDVYPWLKEYNQKLDLIYFNREEAQNK